MDRIVLDKCGQGILEPTHMKFCIGRQIWQYATGIISAFLNPPYPAFGQSFEGIKPMGCSGFSLIVGYLGQRSPHVYAEFNDQPVFRAGLECVAQMAGFKAKTAHYSRWITKRRLNQGSPAVDQ